MNNYQNKYQPWVLVAGDQPIPSQVLTSGGEWRRFTTEQAAREAALDHDTAFACYDGWAPTFVFHDSRIIHDVRRPQ